jgi:hypothetical protein
MAAIGDRCNCASRLVWLMTDTLWVLSWFATPGVTSCGIESRGLERDECWPRSDSRRHVATLDLRDLR